MDGFELDDLVDGEISEEEREMIALTEKFEDIFDYAISLDFVDADRQQLRELLKKSVETKKDYLHRYVIEEVDMDEWFDNLLIYIAETEMLPATKEIHDFIYQFFMDKELYCLNMDEIYGVIHHVYVMIAEYLSDNDSSISASFKNSLEITKFLEKKIEDLVADTLDDLWEPQQLLDLYVLYDEVYETAEKIARGVDDIADSELQEVKNVPDKIEGWKDELDLQRSEYRRIEDVEVIWAYISNEILSDCRYIKTHNREDMSQRLSAAVLSETDN